MLEEEDATRIAVTESEHNRHDRRPSKERSRSRDRSGSHRHHRDYRDHRGRRDEHHHYRESRHWSERHEWNRERSRSHRDRDRNHRQRKDRSRSRSRSHSYEQRERKERKRRGSRSKESQPQSRQSREEQEQRQTQRDRLSAEIELELQNLRRQYDLKEAEAKRGMLRDERETHEADGESTAIDDVERTDWHLRKEIAKLRPDFVREGGGSQKVEYVPEIQTEEERIEFQRKMQEKLQQHLAAEGKLYPRPKPTPAINHATGFANDGSFLEIFKKMEAQAKSGVASVPQVMVPAAVPAVVPVPCTSGAAGVVTTLKPEMPIKVLVAQPTQMITQQKPVPKREAPPPVLPVFSRRRGGKILKTGIVKKTRPIEEANPDMPNDAWNLYLQEVKKYKNASCDADSKTRPLVK